MKLIAFVMFLALAGCQSGQSNTKPNYTDSAAFYQLKDSIMGDTYKRVALSDTGNSSEYPIIVLSAKPVIKEYSNYKDIRLSYKNVSGKTISAIRFKWYGTNAFNEPADMGGVIEGSGAGFIDTPLKNGKSTSVTWEILSKDVKKIVRAWPYEVVFEDGTKWKSQ